ncbi:MAG: transposase [Thermodesulfobacteriota bacterium]
MKRSIPKIRVRFQRKTYTSRAGVKLFSRFAKWFGMGKLVERHLVLSKKERKFTAADLVCSHLAMRCAGLSRISHCGDVAGDPLVLEMAGVEQFPSSHSLYDLLQMFAPSEEMFDEEGVRRLGSLVGMHDGFVRVFFEKAPDWKRRAQRVLTVDVDSHVQTVYGQKPQAARGYNPRKRGRLSYHPLVATISQLRMPLAGLFRGGDTNGRSEIVEFFDMVMEAIQSAGLSPRLIQLRGDAAAVCDQLLGAWMLSPGEVPGQYGQLLVGAHCPDAFLRLPSVGGQASDQDDPHGAHAEGAICLSPRPHHPGLAPPCHAPRSGIATTERKEHCSEQSKFLKAESGLNRPKCSEDPS